MRKSLRGKEIGVGVQGGVKADHEYFLALLKQGTPVKEAKIKAGFSPHTKTKVILAAKKTMIAAKTKDDAALVVDARRSIKRYSTPEEARTDLAKQPGHTFVDNAQKLTDIRDDVYVQPNVAISAIKEHNAMMGYNAPNKTQVDARCLIMELSGVSEEELEYLKENKVEL